MSAQVLLEDFRDQSHRASAAWGWGQREEESQGLFVGLTHCIPGSPGVRDPVSLNPPATRENEFTDGCSLQDRGGRDREIKTE